MDGLESLRVHSHATPTRYASKKSDSKLLLFLILISILLTFVVGVVALILQILIPPSCPTLECENTTTLVANCPPVPPNPIPLGSSDIGPCWQPNNPPTQVNDAMINNKLLQDAISSVNTYLSSQPFGTMSYVITIGDQMIFNGFGLVDTSDQESGSPGPDDVFRVGSITKTFTSAMLYSLWQEGKLGLDELISAKWPEMPVINPFDDDESYNPVTYRMLSSHLSGLLAGFPCIPGDCDYSTQEIFDSFKYPTLQYAPATDPVYNNFAFALLGRLFEHEDLAGEEFETAIGTYIWDSLDINMGWTENDAYIGQVVSNNSSSDYPDLGWMNPAGGAFGSARDMGKWLVWLQDFNSSSILQPSTKPGGAFGSARDMGKWLVWLQDFNSSSILQPSTKRMYLTSQYAFENARELMGAGWDQLWRHGTWVFDKSGELDPFYANAQFIPDMKLGIAILTNSRSSGAPSISELCGQALEFLIPAVDALNGIYGPGNLLPIPNISIPRYIGDYGFSGDTTVYLSIIESNDADGTLILLGREAPEDDLEAWAQLSLYPTYNGDDLKHTLRMTTPGADLNSCYTFRLSGANNDVALFDGLTADVDISTQLMVPSFLPMWLQRIV
ncbi:hypothetical protein ADUPG1_010803 [Aduncisulcus paluster]|uniref:Beta-lactamase-related domain-containing protein n=1 Tax=Aduncisulcus paluster TaxID=2918883 RepID=A0ABQ5JSW1_9EUKA|nr:hypothetical protein ADUPG1_010803 [Aduncisulcus paluster]